MSRPIGNGVKYGGRIKGTKNKPKKSKSPTVPTFQPDAEISEIIDKCISLPEMFMKLGELARGTSKKYVLESIRLILSYRLGKPAQLVIQKNIGQDDTFRQIAKAFADELTKLPPEETHESSDSKSST